MRISKKTIAIVLSVLMAVSMMPFTAFAAGSETQLESSKASVTVKVEDVSVTTYYDSFEEALAACPENATDVATIKLLDDITVTSTVMINNGKNIKLNTNSKTMTSANVDPMFRIEGGKLETSGKGTIQSTTNDCTVFRVVGKKDAEAQWSKLLIGGSNTGNGNCTTVISKEYGVLIPSTNNYADGVYVEVKGIIQSGVSAIYTNGNINKYGTNPAQIVLQNASSPKLICTDDKNNAVHDNVAVYAAGYAEWTFKTGTVTGPTALWAKSGKFNLAGTSFKGNGEEVAYSHNGNGITATGEAVVFENSAGYCDTLDVTISKGTFNSVNADPIGTYAYSKGTDTREEIDEFVSGGAFQNNGVAADVSEYYTDELAEKFATGNAYIESNIFSLDVDGRINASAPGGKIVRDGKDYYTSNVFKAANNAVSGDTVVALTDYSTGSQVVISNPDVTIDLGGHTFNSTNSLYPIRVQDGASATFTNGTITNPNGISMVGDSSLVIADDCVVNGDISNYDTVSSSNATVDIYGTVNGTVAPKTSGTEVNIYEGAEINNASGTAINAKAGTTVNVYGGEVNGTVTETGTGEVNISGGTFDTDVTEYVAEGAAQDPTTGTVTQNYVAKVGDNYFATIQEAFNAVYGTATVTLLADVTTDQKINVFDNTTLDLNGHTLTSTFAGQGGIYAANANLTIKGDGSVVNNSLNYPGNMFIMLLSTSGNSASLTVQDNAIVESNGSTVAIYYKDYANDISINVEGGAIKSTGSAPISVNGNVTNQTNEINISGGTVESTTSAAIYAAGYATTTVSGGTVKGTTGIYAKSGVVNVTGGEVIATGSQNDYAYNGNGYTNTGDAIVIDNCGYPGGAPSASISGGTITSANAEAVSSYVKQDDPTQSSADFEQVVDIIPATSTAVFSTDVTDLAESGYVTEYDANAGGYVVEQAVAENETSAVVGSTIKEKFYLDKAAYRDTAVVKITYNHNSDVTQSKSVSTDTVTLGSLPEEGGKAVFEINQAPAQVTEDVVIDVYANADATTPIDTITFSTYDYCRQLITTNSEAKDLAEATLDYAAAAQTYFNYNTDNMATKDNAGNAFYGDVANAQPQGSFLALPSCVRNATMIVKSDLQINLLANADINVTGSSSNCTAVTAPQNGDFYVVNVSGIAPAEMDEMLEIETDQGEIIFNANAILKVMAGSSKANLATMAKAAYLYGVAADNYFV